jgi:uncharacterized membrane protein YdfJ with MMPL/SSD domain
MYLPLVLSGSGGMIVFDATVLVLEFVLLLMLLFLLLLLVPLTLLPSHCSSKAQYSSRSSSIRGFLILGKSFGRLGVLTRQKC